MQYELLHRPKAFPSIQCVRDYLESTRISIPAPNLKRCDSTSIFSEWCEKSYPFCVIRIAAIENPLSHRWICRVFQTLPIRFRIARKCQTAENNPCDCMRLRKGGHTKLPDGSGRQSRHSQLSHPWPECQCSLNGVGKWRPHNVGNQHKNSNHRLKMCQD
jgi:hypothetical protein